MNSSLPETIRRTQTIGSYIISVSDGPGVYRHIRISQDASLQDLSRIIQQSFGLREGKVPSFIIQPPGRGRELVKYGRNQAGPMLAMRQVRLRDSGLAEARWAQYCMDKPRVAWNCRVKSLLDEPTPEPQILYTSGDFHNLRYKLSEMKTKRRQLAQERARALSEAVLLSDLSDDTARLMVDYILAAANFYGVVPISLVHDMFCRQQRQVNYAAFALFCLDISQAEDSRCHLLDEDWQLVDPDADANGPFVFIASARVVDHWQMPAIKRMQQGKPWYIPKPGMLLPYREEGYVPKSPEYEALRLAIQALKPSAEALDGILHPRWTLGTFLRTLLTRGMPHFENNYATRGAPILSRDVMRDLSDRSHLNWNHFKRIRQLWRGTLLVKGILSAADGLNAVDEGAGGVLAPRGQQFAHALGTHLIELVDATQHITGFFRVGHSDPGQHAVQHPPVVHAHQIVAARDAGGFQRLGQHGHDLGIRRRRGGTHRIRIALIELPEPPRTRLLVPPHRPHRIAPIGGGQIVAILRRHPRQRRRHVIAQRQPVAGAAAGHRLLLPREYPRIGPVHVGQEFSQRFHRFHGRSFQRVEAPARVNLGDAVQHGLAFGHIGAEIVAEALGRLGARAAGFGGIWRHRHASLRVARLLAEDGDMDKQEARLRQLEETLAHVTRLAEDLSDVVARQQAAIARLERRTGLLMAREAEREADGSSAIPLADQRPPHW